MGSTNDDQCGPRFASGGSNWGSAGVAAVPDTAAAVPITEGAEYERGTRFPLRRCEVDVTAHGFDSALNARDVPTRAAGYHSDPGSIRRRRGISLPRQLGCSGFFDLPPRQAAVGRKRDWPSAVGQRPPESEVASDTLSDALGLSGQMTEDGLDLRGVLAIGTALRGYKVDAVLGYGGYGVVYRALHKELRYPVAIKEYLPVDLSVREAGTVHPRSEACREHYEDGKRRFLEEARQIAGLKDHPGVVRCTDFFRANGTAYLVMDYIEGLPLSELLKQREAAGRPFEESDLRMLAIPLLETLSRLHSAGLLHRDIKPSNILVRRADGRPVLIDFGAAKQVTERHSKSAAPFTEGYAALEQVGDGELGPWTDVYAVGAVMWRIVAGANPPWKPPNPKRVELRASAVLDGKPDPLPSAAELGAGRFSRAVVTAVDQCLEVSADKRPKDFDELRTALEGTGRPGRLTDHTALPVAAQRAWRKWPEAVRALLAAGVVIAVLWFASEGIGTTGGRASRAESSTGGGEVSPKSIGVEVWTNSVGMEFVRIPAGEFLMGSTSNLAFPDERPVTQVRIRSAFWMGKYEVTQRQWRAVMGTSPTSFKNCGPDCPVEWVSWDDVQRFVWRLNAVEGTTRYRLPTEA